MLLPTTGVNHWRKFTNLTAIGPLSAQPAKLAEQKSRYSRKGRTNRGRITGTSVAAAVTHHEPPLAAARQPLLERLVVGLPVDGAVGAAVDDAGVDETAVGRLVVNEWA